LWNATELSAPAASNSSEDKGGDILESAHTALRPGVPKLKNKRQL